MLGKCVKSCKVMCLHAPIIPQFQGNFCQAQVILLKEKASRGFKLVFVSNKRGKARATYKLMSGGRTMILIDTVGSITYLIMSKESVEINAFRRNTS